MAIFTSEHFFSSNLRISHSVKTTALIPLEFLSQMHSTTSITLNFFPRWLALPLVDCWLQTLKQRIMYGVGVFVYYFSEIGSLYIAQAGLKLRDPCLLIHVLNYP